MMKLSQYIDSKTGFIHHAGNDALVQLWQTRANMAWIFGASGAALSGLFVRFEHKWENIALMFCMLSAYALISVLGGFFMI